MCRRMLWKVGVCSEMNAVQLTSVSTLLAAAAAFELRRMTDKVVDVDWECRMPAVVILATTTDAEADTVYDSARGGRWVPG